jgi:hypothetical protein
VRRRVSQPRRRGSRPRASKGLPTSPRAGVPVTASGVPPQGVSENVTRQARRPAPEGVQPRAGPPEHSRPRVPETDFASSGSRHTAWLTGRGLAPPPVQSPGCQPPACWLQATSSPARRPQAAGANALHRLVPTPCHLACRLPRLIGPGQTASAARRARRVDPVQHATGEVASALPVDSDAKLSEREKGPLQAV